MPQDLCLDAYAIMAGGEYVCHRSSGLSAKIVLEFDGASPTDLIRHKKELFSSLRGLYKKAMERKEDFVRFVVMEGVSTFASSTPHGFIVGENPVIILSAYNVGEIPDDEWAGSVEFFADTLCTIFCQYHMRVEYSHGEVKTFQKI